ncbi:hypothetical protein chiPu_0033614, partial [Chiloscyllium punctatum]|nr:hypothetical protein [Chiloscyllium punctatum]
MYLAKLIVTLRRQNARTFALTISGETDVAGFGRDRRPSPYQAQADILARRRCGHCDRGHRRRGRDRRRRTRRLVDVERDRADQYRRIDPQRPAARRGAGAARKVELCGGCRAHQFARRHHR